MLSRREVLTCGAGLLAGRAAQAQPSKAPIIRTVLKDVAPESLVGATLFHEHLSLAADFMPKWMAYEMRLMAERFVGDGMLPEAGDVERLTKILGRPLHTYRDFAAQIGVELLPDLADAPLRAQAEQFIERAIKRKQGKFDKT